MEHTPGPWEAAELLPDGDIIKKSGTYEIRTSNYDVVTILPNGGPIRNQADAHLIAAAPDLLAAAEMLVRELDAYDSWHVTWQSVREAVSRGKAAIKKAKNL